MKLRIVIFLLIILILVYFTFVNPTNLLKPFYSIKNLISLLWQRDNYEIVLTSQVESNIIDNLKEEVETLLKLNNLSLSISDYEKINATVISRNKEYWFNTLTINKGSIDGVEEDMAVIDSDGLIGRISMVNKNHSIVKLITTNDTKNKVSALIKNKDQDIYGIINGYDSKNNLLHLIISNDLKIESDSVVLTTGMGGVFPRGILIGKVYDVIKKDDGVTNIVRVIPNSNIEGERYVIVLSRKKISDS